jgi:hypothetical protein
MRRATSPFAVFALALWGATAMAIETPKFQVLKHYDDFETREYPGYLVAETEVEGEQTEVGNEAFSRLGGYIFGKNKGEKKIAMTAPVAQQAEEGAKIEMTAPVAQSRTGPRSFKVQFMMPAGFTLETLPEPKDPRVHLKALPPRRFAVIHYSGTWSQKNYDDHLAQLRQAMKREGLSPQGPPVWARYDPPFKPWFLRTNEILVPVE